VNRVYSNKLYEKFKDYKKEGYILISPYGEIIIDDREKRVEIESSAPIYLSFLNETNFIHLSYINKEKMEKQEEKIRKQMEQFFENLTPVGEFNPYTARHWETSVNNTGEVINQILYFFADRNIKSARITYKEQYEKMTGDFLGATVSLEVIDKLSDENNLKEFSLVYFSNDIKVPELDFKENFYVNVEFDKALGRNDFGYYFYSDEILNIDELEKIIKETLWIPVSSEHSIIEKLDYGLVYLDTKEALKIINELKTVKEIENFNIMYMESFLNLMLKTVKEIETKWDTKRSFTFFLKRKSEKNLIIYDLEIGEKK